MMKIYTKVVSQWDRDTESYIEVSSASYEYEGEVALLGGNGGGGTTRVIEESSTEEKALAAFSLSELQKQSDLSTGLQTQLLGFDPSLLTNTGSSFELDRLIRQRDSLVNSTSPTGSLTVFDRSQITSTSDLDQQIAIEKWRLHLASTNAQAEFGDVARDRIAGFTSEQVEAQNLQLQQARLAQDFINQGTEEILARFGLLGERIQAEDARLDLIADETAASRQQLFNRISELEQNVSIDQIDAEEQQLLQDAIRQAVAPLIGQFNEQILPNLGSAAQRLGAFGGSRQGIVEAQAARDLGITIANISTQMAVQSMATRFGFRIEASQERRALLTQRIDLRQQSFEEGESMFLRRLSLAGFEADQIKNFAQILPDLAATRFLPASAIAEIGAIRQEQAQRIIDAPMKLAQELMSLSVGAPVVSAGGSTTTSDFAKQNAGMLRLQGATSGALAGASVGAATGATNGGWVGAAIGAVAGALMA